MPSPEFFSEYSATFHVFRQPLAFHPNTNKGAPPSCSCSIVKINIISTSQLYVLGMCARHFSTSFAHVKFLRQIVFTNYWHISFMFLVFLQVPMSDGRCDLFPRIHALDRGRFYLCEGLIVLWFISGAMNSADSHGLARPLNFWSLFAYTTHEALYRFFGGSDFGPWVALALLWGTIPWVKVCFALDRRAARRKRRKKALVGGSGGGGVVVDVASSGPRHPPVVVAAEKSRKHVVVVVAETGGEADVRKWEGCSGRGPGGKCLSFADETQANLEDIDLGLTDGAAGDVSNISLEDGSENHKRREEGTAEERGSEKGDYDVRNGDGAASNHRCAASPNSEEGPIAMRRIRSPPKRGHISGSSPSRAQYAKLG